MGDISFGISIGITIVFGVLFIIQELYHEKFRIDYSLVAGISIAYFFLVMLPEVISGLPEFPSHLEDFKYLFPLLGFVTIHLLDKLILQRVENVNQKKIRHYLKNTEDLEVVEDRLSNMVDDEIHKGDFDFDALLEISNTHRALQDQKVEIKNKSIELEKKIIYHVRKDMDEMRDIVEFLYHVIVGIVLIYFMIYNIISGILFFSVSFLMAIITGSPIKYDHQLFTDLNINPQIYKDVEIIKSKKRRLLLGISVLLGILIGLITEIVHEINLEALYMIFAFIAGVLLYIIIHETIPEKELGKPKLFLIGFVVFVLFIYSLRWLELAF